MPRTVEIPGVARLTFPDDISEDEMLNATRDFYEKSQQGALGAAGSAAIREPARQIGGAIKASARLGDWFQPPDVNPETGIPVWQRAESTFMGPEIVTPVEKPPEVPLEQTGLYKAGEALQRGAEKMFPVSPLREEDFLTQVGAGLGSLPTSVIPYAGPLIYGLSAGEDAAEKAGKFYDNKIAEAMAAGNTAEASRLQEEKKSQQAIQFGINAPLGYATERLLGVVPGVKQITEGGGKMLPKLAAGQTVENAKKVAAFLAKQGTKTAAGEFAQEGLEQTAANIGEKAYNPDAEFTAGVLDASTAGGAVGYLASVPLSLIGSKLRKNRLDQIRALRDTRLAEGPLSERQISEINNRIISGQPLTEPDAGSLLGLLSDDPATRSSVGGNNAELLPNSAATLAGINSGGAPSGPFRITPPKPPEGEIVLPAMELEGEETATTTPDAIQKQVTDESVLRGEEAQPEEQLGLPKVDRGGRPPESRGAEAEGQAEIQPLTIEETQEYNRTVDSLGGASAYDLLTPDEFDRFQSLADRISQLEEAGWSFDEQAGWVKPGGVAPAPTEPTPTVTPTTPTITPSAAAAAPVSAEEIRASLEQKRRAAQAAKAGAQPPTAPGITITPGAPTITVAPPAAPAEVPIHQENIRDKTGVLRDWIIRRRNADERGADANELSWANKFDAWIKLYKARPFTETLEQFVEKYKEDFYGVQLAKDFTPQQRQQINELILRQGALSNYSNTGVFGQLSAALGKLQNADKQPAAPTPPVAPIGIGERLIGFGKYSGTKIKDLYTADPNYAFWLVRSTRSARPGSPQRQVGDYVAALPEYQQAATKAKAEAEAVLTNENKAVLAKLRINASINPDGSIDLSGNTRKSQDDIKAEGGRYSTDSRSWTIDAAGLGRFIGRSGPDSGAPGQQRSNSPAYTRNAELRKLREDADNRPDRSGLEGGVDNHLGVDTQELIRQGEKFGIPRVVGDEQIEDAALMVQAFSNKRPFFMLSSAPGTGKTYVLGAGIREMRKRGAKKIIYVTLNKGLIKQINQDLKDYGIGDVRFITYSEMKDLTPEESDVLIFDEAHAIKNLTGSGSEQAKKAQEWIQRTGFPVFSTATPFENPTQTAYLLNTGIFDSFGDYKQFALAYGATPIRDSSGNIVRTVWLPTKTNEQDQIAARNFFRKEGIFTARKTRLPANQVDSRLVAIKGDEEWTNTYNAFSDAAEAQKSSLDGTEKMWIINYKKRLLEASKIRNAIGEARRALSAGRWPIIFVETKAERSIDIEEQRRLQDQYKRDKALAKMMGGETPRRSDYPGLLSDGIISVLEATMDRLGTTVISIPSAEDVIKSEIGANDVAIFTGSVPDARAQKNLDLWRGNRPMVLVATMAKGGTGLSLHDKTGNHPTTQINVNLPWTATQVEQVSLRSARYGLKGTAQMQWLFADNIPFERELAARVGGRMRDMGALVQGEAGAAATNIKNFNFEDESFSEANAAAAAAAEAKKEPVEPPAAPAPPAAPEAAPTPPAAPAPPAAPKTKKAREWTFRGDILDDIIELGGIMSKAQAKKEGRLAGIKSLYDDAPRLKPIFNKIYQGRSRNTTSRNQPDVLLQELAMQNPGKYGDMTIAEFWAAIEKAARGREGDTAERRREAEAAAAGEEEAKGLNAFLQAQDDEFADAQTEAMQRAGEPDGPIQISVGDLAKGDTFSVQGELFEVTAVTADGEYTVRDGDRFGVQSLSEYDTIFVDRPPEGGGGAIATPGGVPAAPGGAPTQAERKPRLAAGENQGDLISSTQSEMRGLVGEEQVDLEARKREAAAAARAAAEAKAAQDRAQTQLDLGEAASNAADAVAQFVESITPKAGITEGPTPEESARRVLKALADLASAAIRAGVQSATEWAASMNLKLGPALQYAWDQASGVTADPTAEAIADVENIPKQSTSSDFGMIYSTPEEPVTTKRGGFEDVVAGRRSLTPEVRDAGVELAVSAFNEAGVKFRQVGPGLFAPTDDVNQEEAGRRLLEVAKKKIQQARAAGRQETLFALINSLRNHFSVSTAFTPETRSQMYITGQSEASAFGSALQSLNLGVQEFVAFARNVPGYLTSFYFDTLNGQEITTVLEKILTRFRNILSDEEINKITVSNPELAPMIDRLGIMALAETGSRVYRAVQGRLKQKAPTTQAQKNKRAIEDEAIDQIIENALALGVQEPPKPANRRLTSDQRLALMTKPETQAKIQRATEDAVSQAEFNAGWRVMMAKAAQDENLLAQYQEAMAAGESPDADAIEEGLDLPQYQHWRTIRDGFLNYSPTTLKLAQDVIRGRFKGVRFGEKRAAPPAPPKIDLARLVQSPNAEMSRVIGEQLNAISNILVGSNATPEARARVMQMITANVGSQIQLARQRVLNNFLDTKARVAPVTASDRLKRLINAGITEDPRYKSQKTRDLLKRVANRYIDANEFLGMATRTREEKLRFLTQKLNQVITSENLTDEWMQGAVWTHLTERMMEAESSVVSQIVGAKDVSFEPALPKTDAQRQAERAKAIERLTGGIRAGLLDQRIAETVARNPAFQKLVPKIGDLVKRVLQTPQGTQAQLAKAFSNAILSELAIDQALADKTGAALAKAFQLKFEQARVKALKQAVEKLTPKEAELIGPGTPLWKKIEQFVNAGGMDSAVLLQNIAKSAGWRVPTEAEVSRLRDLARLEQELSTATAEEKQRGITDDIKQAANQGQRAEIMREIQRRWASMTMPIRGNKVNRAKAINEVISANLLFKAGFITKQLIDTATQMFYYTPTRAIAAAAERYRVDRSLNRQTRLWKDSADALQSAYKARFDALGMALGAMKQAAKGRGERDTIAGIQSGIRAIDRINAQADEYMKQKNYPAAFVFRLIGLLGLSFRFASALDAFQGILAEQQEIGAWAEGQFRLQGLSQEAAKRKAREIMGDAAAEYAMAQAIVGDNFQVPEKDRAAAAWNVVRARQYQRAQAAGLAVDDLRGLTERLRATIGWNVQEEGGVGGIVGKGMKTLGGGLEKMGIPTPVSRFSNAIAIGINRSLTFAGGGFVPDAFKGSAWYKTSQDRTQRKIEAATGLALSGAFAALVLSGALRVFTRWPDDKEEQDLLEREGHRPNTMELDIGGGRFLRVSLNTGPLQVVRPVLAGIGELQYQVWKRNRLNQKAAAAAKKKGLAFEPRELTAKDMLWAAAYGTYSAMLQGRTASGLIGSATYRQALDMNKMVAGAVSPMIPFGPLMRETAALSGAQFDPKEQTFINLLAPTPWSGKVDRNFLGDPVGTPRAQERIISILTGGTAIAGGTESDRAYQVLDATGWTPATPQNNKFFQFGRVQRQATPEELTKMQEVRAMELKTRISQLDPATATKRRLDRIEDIANAKAKRAVGAR